jgi:cellulose synthase/poly-beta-1,6-N-acetylglucosamine synthase-like glycosyltransferase/peptidoglycan/xylan/chitin deacetylase (PgdA/CDA1 family)
MSTSSGAASRPRSREGSRALKYDEATGLITEEQFREFPSAYVIARRGAGNRRQVALTFDDGPDPTWTPRILDVLQREHAPATFFVIGLSADQQPGLLRRMVAEGHEIGNHTFTHPDISAITRQQLRLEMNATERLLESVLGRRSLLFRPPYAEDVEPETPDEVSPLLFTSGQGYYTIGMAIDPNDWQGPGVDAIVKSALDQVRNNEGRIVLLHDGGGDRSETIEALPRLIQALRKEGYQLVTVSDLMGLTRDAVMPPVPSSDWFSLLLLDAGFLAIGSASAVLRSLFLVGIVLGVGRLSVIGLLALVQAIRAHRHVPGEPEAVAVVVPAFNEEKVIVQTVRSLLASNGPAFEIVVVDDGSWDDTYAVVTEAFRGEPRVRAFRKPNGGKAGALNYGIRQTTAPIVIALDADTVFHPDTVQRLAAAFRNATVGAVAGNAKVGNRINLLTKWQALEYVTSQNLDRRAFDVLNGITVVPGAVGAWRRDLILEAGGFSTDTLAEDADLTMSVLRRGYDVVYEDRAVAWTEAPDTVAGLLKQRFRWVFGTLQAAWKQRGTILRPRFGGLGMVAMPNLIVFQVLFPLVSPVMDLHMLLSLIAAAMQQHQHPTEFSSDIIARTAFFYAVFVAVDLAAAVLAFCLERREDWRLLMWLPLQRFVYRQLMYYVLIKSMVTALRGSVVGWGKLERKATVTQ